MSLVENLINQISNNGLSGITQPFGVDLTDDTFSKLLDKQLNSISQTNDTFSLGSMGAPAGLFIEPINGVDFSNTVQDQLEVVGENKLTNEISSNAQIEIQDMDFGDYFSNLLKTSSENNSNFMNFAKRQANNAYNVFSRAFVSDIQDFIDDIASMT